MADFAAVLRRLREQAELTQEELADRAGVSARTVSDIERGLRKRVYSDTAGRLAAALALDDAEREQFVRLASRRAVRDTPTARLPHPLTPLIGRGTELTRAVAGLQPGAPGRLVTVTGLGGSGKTRLAVEAAHRLLPSYAGRVWFVPLGAAQSAEWFADAVARAVGTVPSGIPAAVGSRPALLVLDAFEHVLPATNVLLQLLHDTSGLRVLVTSRVSLGISGEYEVALGPLAAEHAARLFLDRARGVVPDLPDDPAGVADICALAGGLPLAIELAAAQVRYLPTSLLTERLRRGSSDANRVVTDAVAWSVSSLSDEQRQVLACAAMFPTGCRLDALEAVVAGVDVLGALDAIVKKCLVALDRASDVPRWRLLDVVREEIARAQPVHRDRRASYTRFYQQLLRDVSPHVGHEDAWYRVLGAEEPNIRAALAQADAEHDAETLLDLATGMWLFWQARGGLAEGRSWLARGLTMRPAAAPALRLKALWGLAWLAYHQGDDEAAAAAGAELAHLAESDGDDAARRNALTIAGIVAIAREDPEAALARLSDALTIARTLGQPWILATSLLNLALGQLAAESPAPARALLGEALQHYEAIGDRRFQARCVGYLGLAALLDDDAERAQALFQQALGAFRDTGEPAGIAEALAGLAAVAARTDRPAAAATLAAAADRVRHTVGARELPLERRIAARYLGLAAERLSRAAWDEAWRCGLELSTEDAVALALNQSDGIAAPTGDGSGHGGHAADVPRRTMSE